MIAFMSLGGSEVLIILLLVLLLFGAKRLPDLARSLGQAKREFQKATHEVSREVDVMVKPAEARPAVTVSTGSTVDSSKKT